MAAGGEIAHGEVCQLNLFLTSSKGNSLSLSIPLISENNLGEIPF